MKLCERKGVMCECITDHSVCNSDNCHRKLPDAKSTSGLKVVISGEGRPSKSWLEIYTENIEKETARKIFADIDNASSPYIGRTLMLNRYIKDTDVEKLKKKYGVED